MPMISRFRKPLLSLAMLLAVAAPSIAQTVHIDTATPVNSIDPRQAVGAGIDRIPVDAIDHDLSHAALPPILAAGWQPVTYRQNTDLGVEAWHWNPEGTWSDPAGQQGYFIGSATSTGFIRHSFGYELPHRGFTRNNGTGNSGYSRMTDGDESTYWKSNPYLTSRYTGEGDALHPQWIVLDLSHYELVDTLRISWATPYAASYVIQYWTGTDPMGSPTRGAWVSFPYGVVSDARGGIASHKLADAPVNVRFLRVLMTQSSNTCGTHGAADPRNCVGYAIRELYLGTTSSDGVFHDLLRHTADQEQTATYCSSVDSWHSAQSLVNKQEAQVGFDLFFQSGITRGLPAMMPVALLYETPENATAEIRYLENHKYPISYVEIGEEADGQYMSPEDYGALYVQFARAIRSADPGLRLGGPSFEGVNDDIEAWPDAEGRSSWLARFLLYLRGHSAIHDLQFFSFEHYPLDPCRITWSSLYEEPELLRHIIEVWHNDGLPANIPYFITESNLSSATSETYEDIFSGLWLADYIGAFLADGGSGVYYFHYLPMQLEHGCNDSTGTFGMFTVNQDFSIRQPLAQYFVATLINREWLQPDGVNQLYPAASDITDGAGHTLVTAYAARHPDGQWSVMIVNKDQEASHRVRLAFTGEHPRFTGPVDESVFGRDQYHWVPPQRDFNAHKPDARPPQNMNNGGYADPDGPVVHRQVSGDSEVELPAASLVVLRGRLQ